MCRKRILPALVLSGLLPLGALQSAFGQSTTSPCPTDATQTGVGLLFEAFRANPDGTPGASIGSGLIGTCECIVLQMTVTYPGGNVAFFEGGTMRIFTGSGSFNQFVTPSAGVPLIGNPADPDAAACGTTAVPSVASEFSDVYCVDPEDIDPVTGQITFFAEYIGGFQFLGTTPVPNQPTSTTGFPVSVDEAPACSIEPESESICVGESATFTATATGAEPLTYCWKRCGADPADPCLSSSATLEFTNAQVSDSGCYELTVTDVYGCVTTCTAELVVNAPPPCEITGDLSVCPGETTEICGPDGDFSYSWSTGETTQCITVGAGTYSLTVTDNLTGCTSTCEATVTENGGPVCTIEPSTATVCVGESATFVITITGGTGPYTVNITGCETVTLEDQNSPIERVIQCTAPGECTLTVTITDANGCPSEPCTATLTCEECGGNAGCTPGFWKNCVIHWDPTPYDPNQAVGSVFELGDCCEELESATLIQALSFTGGSGECGAVRNLLRAAVAALLNASSPEVAYPRTEGDVIADVNEALATCTRTALLNLAGELDEDNNLGCVGEDGVELPCKRLTIVP